MNIVILGAGSIGSHLALVLSQEGHNIVVIDRDEKALARIARSADIATRLGSGTDWSLLEGIKEISPNFFIAMSSNDETNLAACAIAKSLGYPKTAARIRQSTFLDNNQVDFNRLFSVDHIIGTEFVVAYDIFKSIIHPGNLAIENFAHGAVQMRTIIVAEGFCERGRPLAEVTFLENLLVGLIRRKVGEDKHQIIFPRGQDVLLPGDEVTVFGKTAMMHHLPQFFGMPEIKIRTAVLVGGSGVTEHLAKLLMSKEIKIKIIEPDEGKCLELAQRFPTATILNHEGTDLNFLVEEGINYSDILVCCTETHEVNILAAILGKQAGCKEVIALVSDESVVPLLEKFQISHALSERASITRRIQLILHDKAILSLASMYDNQAKIIEVKLSQHSRFVGVTLADSSAFLPKNTLIAMVKNKDGVIVPKGNSKLSSGDSLIVVCGSESVSQLRELF